jgi:maleate isomerase
VISPDGIQLGIGVVVPHDMALDRELWRWTPPDVTLLVTRTALVPLTVTVEQARRLGDAALIAAAARDVATPGPLVCAYVCTSGSFVRGPAGERELVAAMVTSGIPDAVTSSGALVEALRRLGARTVGLATPYDEQITALLVAFLAETGFAVARCAQLGLAGAIPAVPVAEVAALIRKADHPAADAIVVSCTNLHTYDVIAVLEAELGKPVISASQATMWAALRRVGRRPVGPGQRLVEA